MKPNNENQLLNRRIRPTAMRELVLKVLTDQTTAISLSELEKKFDRADKVTLYRTLKTFEEKKLIHSIDDGTGSMKYALCKETCQCNPEDLHIHFLCSVCSKTYCLDDITVPQVQLPAGFTLESLNLIIKGKCANCKK
jgi:Fur family ferric uptake transcriptional regulator